MRKVRVFNRRRMTEIMVNWGDGHRSKVWGFNGARDRDETFVRYHWYPRRRASSGHFHYHTEKNRECFETYGARRKNYKNMRSSFEYRTYWCGRNGTDPLGRLRRVRYLSKRR